MHRPRLGGRRQKRSVTPLALGRMTAWGLAVWSAYIAAWAGASGSSPGVVVAWWLAGVCVVNAIAPDVAESGESASLTEVLAVWASVSGGPSLSDALLR